MIFASFRTLPSIRAIPIRLTRPSHFTFSPVIVRPRFSARPLSKMESVFTKDAPFPVGPYSQAIKTPTAIYCSGQIHLSPEGQMIDGTIAEKTELCIKNLQAVLAAAGSSIDKVVKTTIFLADMSSFAEMNSTYEKWFTHKPARSCVAAKTLPKGADVEIECVALP